MRASEPPRRMRRACARVGPGRVATSALPRPRREHACANSGIGEAQARWIGDGQVRTQGIDATALSERKASAPAALVGPALSVSMLHGISPGASLCTSSRSMPPVRADCRSRLRRLPRRDAYSR